MTEVRLGEVDFWIDTGRTLTEPPRFALSDLTVGPTRDVEEHELHLTETFGCGDWRVSGTEELRFSTTDLHLVSAWLGVPVDSAEGHETPEAWAARTVVVGIPTARDVRPFRLPPEVSRHFSVEFDMLACFVAEVSSRGERMGVEVATGLELLFADGRYAGWLLRAPETALGHGRRDAASTTGTKRDPELVGWLAEYYTLTRDETIADIELGEDLDALDAMRDLRARIRLDGDPLGRRQVLHRTLSTWVDNLTHLLE